MPKVSVIIPNYNHAGYLERRLDSVLSQSLQDIEVILLDDASTDDSLSIVEAYSGDDRLKVHVNRENSGSPFKQWNKGIELAEGEFIWIAESDDYADAKFLETLVDALSQHPEAGLGYCQSWVVEADPESTSKTLLAVPYAGFSDRARWTTDYTNSGANEILNYLIYNNTIPNASAVVFRASVLNDGLRAREDMRLAGDWMFWVRILIKSDLVFIAKPLNYFRATHPSSQRAKTADQGLDLLEGLEIYPAVSEHLPIDSATKRKMLLERTKVWGTLAWMRRLSWKTNRAIYAKLCETHPNAKANSSTAIIVPFVFYFLTAPLRRIKWISF